MGSRTWLVRSERGTFVAKAVADTASQFDRGLEAAEVVEASGISAGAPIRTADGTISVAFGEERVALLRFVPGEPVGSEHAGPWGAALARAHEVLVGRDDLAEGLERLPLINLEDPSLDVEPWIHPAIEPTLEAVMRYDGEVGVLHGDPARAAFLVDEDASVGIIDWGAVWWGPLLYDVASLQMYAGEDFAAALDGYRSVRPVDISSLDVFLRFRWCVQAAYFAWRIANDVMTGIDDASENATGLSDARRNLGA